MTLSNERVADLCEGRFILPILLITTSSAFPSSSNRASSGSSSKLAMRLALLGSIRAHTNLATLAIMSQLAGLQQRHESSAAKTFLLAFRGLLAH
jgi:hypothetical protein